MYVFSIDTRNVLYVILRTIYLGTFIFNTFAMGEGYSAPQGHTKKESHLQPLETQVLGSGNHNT